jgi:hypothetical protein
MNRRVFLKAAVGLSAALAVPIKALAKELPAQWGISPVRWHRAYDLYRDEYLWRADVFVGRCVEETPERITLENPYQFMVDMRSENAELTEAEKAPALHVLMNDARARLAEVRWTA